MSNAVGKAREHAEWERRRSENRLATKITTKSVPDDEIKHRVLAVAENGKMLLRDLPYVLRLPVGNWSRLNEIVDELEREGRVRMLNPPEGKTIERVA